MNDLTLSDEVSDNLDWLFNEDALQNPAVEASARLLFLDTLGCSIGGGAKSELKNLAEQLAAFESGSVRLPGMAHGLTAPAAAGWSAMAATWDEACEGLARAHGRPGLHAFPVAIALTLAGGGTLRDALTALVRGYEIGGRLGERLRIKAGMHVDGVWGAFGAVAAAGSVLGQSAGTVMDGINAAACQTPMSLYLPVAQGATARNTYVAEAARRAINIAVSVGAGVTSPVQGLEASEQLGIYLDRDDSGSGQGIAPRGEWLITQGYLKPFAAVRHVHYGAEAARLWCERSSASASEIDAMSLTVYPEAVTYCGNRSPRTAIAAQFSLTHGIAHMLVAGTLGPDAYTPEALAHPETTRLEQLITVTGRPAASPDRRYATLEIRTASGDRDTVHVDGVLGDEGNPMTVDDVTAKFCRYSDWLPEPWPAASVADSILSGPGGASLGSVVGLTG